jgi:hypothetical protein
MRRITLLGDFRTAHQITITIEHDHDEGLTETRTFSNAEILALRGVDMAREQFSIRPTRIKSQAIRVKLDIADATTYTAEFVRLQALSIEVQTISGTRRMPAGARK